MFENALIDQYVWKRVLIYMFPRFRILTFYGIELRINNYSNWYNFLRFMFHDKFLGNV